MLSLNRSSPWLALRVLAAAVVCCIGGRAAAFTANQTAALKALNNIRAQAHLPPAALDASLCRSAQAHADYRLAHEALRESAHYETPGQRGFTGRSPFDRMRAAGYRGNRYSECISFGVRTAGQSVSGLIRVPYHRLAFLEGDTLGVGVGAAEAPGHAAVWVFDMSGSVNAVSLWPPDGATGIPIGGKLHETPDPLEIHGKSGSDVGYVISASFDTPYRFVSAKLTTKNGSAVDTYINNSTNDPMCDASIFIIPAHRLQPNTEYRAEIHLRSRDGEAIDRVWKFSTEGGDAHGQ